MSNRTFTTRLSAWMFAPLLVAACGSEGAGGSGNLVTIPDCANLKPGSVLSTDSTGNLICKDLPPGAVSLPNCKPDSEALTSDGKTVFCTNRNNETNESRTALENISKSEMMVTDYGTRIMALGSGPGAKALYVGNTTATTNGRIDGKGGATDFGMQAAAKICAAQFGAGARMCTVYDIYYSVVGGKIAQNVDIPKAWVYMQSWKTPVAGPTEPTAGLNDNCAGYTYPTSDKKWVGTAFSYANVPGTGNYAPKFFSGSDTTGLGAPCQLPLPIACCK